MEIKNSLLTYVVGGVNVDLIKRYGVCVGFGLGVALLTIASFVALVFWVDSKKKVKCTASYNNTVEELEKLAEYSQINI